MNYDESVFPEMHKAYSKHGLTHLLSLMVAHLPEAYSSGLNALNVSQTWSYSVNHPLKANGLTPQTMANLWKAATNVIFSSHECLTCAHAQSK